MTHSSARTRIQERMAIGLSKLTVERQQPWSNVFFLANPRVLDATLPPYRTRANHGCAILAMRSCLLAAGPQDALFFRCPGFGVAVGLCAPARRKLSHRRWRRRIPAHLGVPVSPRARIDDPRGSAVKSFTHIIIRNVTADDPHVFVASVGHGICHEAYWICESMFRRLEPNYPPRKIQS